MRFRFACAVLLMLAAAPLLADAVSVQSVCEDSPTIAAQRERLQTLAREAEGTPAAAADAWLALGRNYEYEGAADSALACYRRAIERRGEPNELILAADVLLRRADSGDAQEALGYVERAMNSGPLDGAAPQTVRARMAWAHFLLGHTDQASTMFTRMERSLYRDPLWMLRMGEVALAHGDAPKAYALLYPVALLSRGQAEDAMDMISKVADRMGAANRAEQQILYDISIRDRRHDAWLTALKARRVKFSGTGSFPMGGTLFEPAGKGSHPGIVTLIAPDDSLYSWDSLGVRLRDAGFAVLFVDGRGSGWSVGRSAPLPAAWNGRRAAMVEATADDGREAFRALKLSAKVDTSRYTLMASTSMAMPALMAAERDPRIQSIVLLSPNLSMVERGPAREIMKRIQVPLYATETTIDRLNGFWIDPLYQAAPRGISRVGSATSAGTGPEALRTDAANTARLVEWLKEKRPARSAAKSPRG